MYAYAHAYAHAHAHAYRCAYTYVETTGVTADMRRSASAKSILSAERDGLS